MNAKGVKRKALGGRMTAPIHLSSLIIHLFLLSLILHSSSLLPSASAQRRSGPPTNIHFGPPFSFDLLTFKPQTAGSDSVRLDIYLAVPFQSLEFLYAGDKYVADYAASVEIALHDGSAQVLERYQAHNVLETTSQHEERTRTEREHADASQFSVSVVPGMQYDVHLTIRDLNSKHAFDTTVHYAAKDFRSAHASMSDLMLYRSRRGQRVLPLIGSDVASLNSAESGIFAEMYHLPADTTLGIVSEVFAMKKDHTPDEDNIASRSTSIVHTPSSSDTGITAPTTVDRMPLFQNVSFDDLWMGRYELRTFILANVADTVLRLPNDLAKHAIVEGVRHISVSAERGIPISEPDIEMAIEQLRLITTGSEWDSLNAAQTTKEKRAAILEFWRKRNPDMRDHGNRPMQIFYARVQYANDHFGAGFSTGWKSDRGRVYIALGPPDFVDSHPYEAMQKPYEMWEYSTYHMKYYFVDQYMLGDFRLSGAGPAPGTFVWDN